MIDQRREEKNAIEYNRSATIAYNVFLSLLFTCSIETRKVATNAEEKKTPQKNKNKKKKK